MRGATPSPHHRPHRINQVFSWLRPLRQQALLNLNNAPLVSRVVVVADILDLLYQLRFLGAEPARGNDMQQSLRSGRIVSIEVPRTICDGQQTQAVGVQPFEVIRAMVTDVLTASDPDVVDAMRFAFERLKVVLEPSGACALAALMANAGRFEGRRVGITLSGGNVGLDRFVALVSGAERAD